MEQRRNAIMAAYEGLLSINQAMLESARAQQWQHLIELESDYLRGIEQLRELEQHASLDVTRKQTRQEVLKQLVTNSDSIRIMLEGRLEELKGLMSNAGTRRRLEHAYASNDYPRLSDSLS